MKRFGIRYPAQYKYEDDQLIALIATLKYS